MKLNSLVMVGFFAGLPGKARAAVSSLWSNMVGVFNSVKSGASNIASATVNAVVNFFKGLPGKARSAVSALWSSMVGAFNSAKSGASNSANSIVSSVWNILKQIPGKARSAVSGVKSAILGAFSGAGSWLYSAGANILHGLANGIKGAVGAAVSAAKSAVGSVISGAKSALGINSPSKVAEKEIGRWFMPGVARGVVKSVPAARRDVAAATRSLVPSFGSRSDQIGPRFSGAGSGAAGNTNYFAPGSIVLDASKLRSIQDVIDLIDGIGRTSRTAYAAGR